MYNLAANMGGMGFIEHNKALCMLSVLINTHMLQEALKKKCPNILLFFFGQCYNGDRQKTSEAPPLKETDAYPALAEDSYGGGKLFSERMCQRLLRNGSQVTEQKAKFGLKLVVSCCESDHPCPR